jgi:hypothetical protein
MKRFKEPKGMPRFKEPVKKPVNKELVNKPVNKEPANHTTPVELKRSRAVIKPNTLTTKATKRMSAMACSTSASRPNKKLKRQHVHEHVQVYAGQAVKGGLEQRVNRCVCV